MRRVRHNDDATRELCFRKFQCYVIPRPRLSAQCAEVSVALLCVTHCGRRTLNGIAKVRDGRVSNTGTGLRGQVRSGRRFDLGALDSWGPAEEWGVVQGIVSRSCWPRGRRSGRYANQPISRGSPGGSEAAPDGLGRADGMTVVPHGSTGVPRDPRRRGADPERGPVWAVGTLRSGGTASVLSIILGRAEAGAEYDRRSQSTEFMCDVGVSPECNLTSV